ncbi:MAG TPA: DUF4397 domain-containing protein [Cyclobacteriaceae bacterium]|nr:DUF4397 domain-containing protein [Cyclobacteriaceae bacterium]
MRMDKMDFMSRWMVLFIVLGVSSCLSSDNNGGATPQSVAGVAFFHCAPSTPNIAITIDGNAVTGGSLTYGNFSGYANLSDGAHKIRFSTAGDNATLIDSSYTLQALTTSTIFLFNRGTNTKSFVSLDAALAGISPNNAMFRFAHMSADMPDVKVGVAGQTKPIADQISAVQITPFADFLAQRLTVEVRAVNDNHLIISKIIDPLPAKYYTVVLVGSASAPAGSANELKLLLGESN